MRLRSLQLKDAPLMLEWMSDENVVSELGDNFKEKILLNAETFILESTRKENDLHLAIVSDEDEYMGSVCLINIDRINLCGEVKIIVRNVAKGRGYAWFGLEEIIRKAFDEYELECIYWCVSRRNESAIRFYDKHNFHEAFDISDSILEQYKEMNDLKWYSILKGDVLDNRTEVAGCKIVRIKTIPTLNAGELSFFEATHDVPFEFKRIYYIYKVPEGVRRGFHGHKALKQLLFCPYGRIQLILENKNGREEIELSDPSIGVVIEEPTWREMLWLQKDSVLCVAASEFYEAEDYIRDYNEFRKYIEESVL